MGSEIIILIRNDIECIEILFPTNPKIQSGDKIGMFHPAITLLKNISDFNLLINENGETIKVKKSVIEQ